MPVVRSNVIHGAIACLLLNFVSSATAVDLSPTTAKSVRELLEVGFQPGKESLPKAKSLFEAAVKSGDKSPELAYAYGLVLVKQFKTKEATEQFRIAAENPEAPYWPAWQALVFTHFSAKETIPGYDRLSEFAKRLQQADPEVPLDEQERNVQWMGRLMGGLVKLAESPKAQETVKKQDHRLRDSLAERLRPSYDEGWLEADDTGLLIDTELNEAKLLQQAKNEQERVEKKEKLESSAEAAEKKVEAVKKTAENAKRLLDDQLKQIDRLLARLEKEHGLLERRAQENVEMQFQIDRQITNRQQQPISNGAVRVTGANRNVGQQNRTITQQNRLNNELIIDQLLNQKIQLQFDNDRISQEAFATSQNAARVVNQRQAMIQLYQQKTGQLVKEEAAVQKWQDRLKKDSEKLNAPASDKGKEVARTMTKAKSLRTYIDFNINDERQRLLDQIDPPMPKVPQDDNAKNN